MRVLVIGGSRFIGLATVNRLLADGHKVTLLNRGQTADSFGTRVSRIIGDRSDPETLQRAVARRDFDAVLDVIAFREEDTQAAVDRLRGRIGHYIHISTASVYLIRDRLFCPFREEDFAGRLAPRTETASSSWLYAYHKRRCELVLQRAWESHQLPFTALRLPMVVGPEDYTERARAYLERLADGGPIILP
ncbi:MAG: NAD-dependent epimerase/dehydratase family protein, partial [Acidobacteriota bacterium]